MTKTSQLTNQLVDIYHEWDNTPFHEKSCVSITNGNRRFTIEMDKSPEIQHFIVVNGLGGVYKNNEYVDIKGGGKKYYYATLTLESTQFKEDPVSRIEALEFADTIYKSGIDTSIEFKNFHFTGPIHIKGKTEIIGEATFENVNMQGMVHFAEMHIKDQEFGEMKFGELSPVSSWRISNQRVYVYGPVNESDREKIASRNRTTNQIASTINTLKGLL